MNLPVGKLVITKVFKIYLHSKIHLTNGIELNSANKFTCLFSINFHIHTLKFIKNYQGHTISHDHENTLQGMLCIVNYGNGKLNCSH